MVDYSARESPVFFRLSFFSSSFRDSIQPFLVSKNFSRFSSLSHINRVKNPHLGGSLFTGLMPTPSSRLLVNNRRKLHIQYKFCRYYAISRPYRRGNRSERTNFRTPSSAFGFLPVVSFISSSCSNFVTFSLNGEDRVVVGTLDVNQCIRLPDEIVGKKPQELERLLAAKERQ